MEACAACNNGTSDDDVHFRNVLMLSGKPNAAVMELWQGPVRRSLAQVDGRRRALDVFNLLKALPDLPDDQYMIYPAEDERILGSIRKITRGLCIYHKMATPVPDSQVWADVLRYKVPKALLEGMKPHHAVPQIFSYRFALLEESNRSAWLLEFYERTRFISMVEHS